MSIKEDFFKYIGDEQSFARYQRSYKLILLKYLFELIDSEGKAREIDIARRFKKFYEDRKSRGLHPDVNVDPRIQNIDTSTINQVIAVIRENPLRAISSNGFIQRENINGEEYYSFNPELLKELTEKDKQELSELIDKKIKLYFERIDSRENNMGSGDLFKKQLEEFMNNYLRARTSEVFARHPLGYLIRNEIPKKISDLPFIDTNIFKVHGSCGQGNWAVVPWVAILNKNITTTTQVGVYIVYLFSDDMKRLYLTLNQGCTKLRQELGSRKAIEKMQNVSKSVRNAIKNTYFNADNNLTIGNEFYEQGCIYYKEYLANSIPEDAVLFDDLRKMVEIYNTYYDLFIQNERGTEQMDENEDNQIQENEQEAENQNRGASNQVSIIEEFNVKDEIQRICEYIRSKGFSYDDETIINFYLSLKSKPFVILAGTSGTGKSKLVKLFAEAIGATSDNGRFKLIPVRPDWSDSTDLLGYRDLHGKFHPGSLLSFIKEASEHTDLPYFLCLDEMNLARVEYYFSEILSIMETRTWEGDRIITDRLFSKEFFGNDEEAALQYLNLHIPENLYIVGTVNMDETTFPFSKKVLDRANTIEFSHVDLDFLIEDTEQPPVLTLHNSFLKSEFIVLQDCKMFEDTILTSVSILKDINKVLLEANQQFGYRIRDEVCFYMVNNQNYDLLPFNKAMDYEILQKILPRIQGSSMPIKRLLIELFKICINNKEQNFSPDNAEVNEEMFKYINNNPSIPYMKSALKIASMMRRFEEDGFTSYWM